MVPGCAVMVRSRSVALLCNTAVPCRTTVLGVVENTSHDTG